MSRCRGKANAEDRALGWGRRAVRGVLALVLAAGLAVPLGAFETIAPAFEGEETAKAYAAVGSTDYRTLFNCENKGGEPGDITSGGLLTYARTSRPGHYDYFGILVNSQRVEWDSSAFFFSNQAIPLTFDWTVSVNVSLSDINFSPAQHKTVSLMGQFGLTVYDSIENLQGIQGGIVHNRETGTAERTQFVLGTQKGGYADKNISIKPLTRPSTPAPYLYAVTFSYSYANNRLTMICNGFTESANNVTSLLGSNSAYLYLGGRCRWENLSDLSTDKHPENVLAQMQFESIELPHFDPKIKDIKIYDKETGKEIKANDVIKPGTKVRVVCQVWNANSSAGNEQFPVHVKQDASLVQNFTPDASVKVKVNGAATNESLTQGDGVSVSLKGQNVTLIEYEGTIGSGLAKATKVGYTLTDDIFKSTDSQQLTLLEASSLVLGPDNPEGSDLTPGTDYHYTRLPAPNENGWNNTPVAVKFYPGDHDSFTITPFSATSIILTASTPQWVRTEDVDRLALSYQAANSFTGVPSDTASDVMRIDTTPPTVSLDRDAGSLVVDDNATAQAAGVSSGVWRLYETDAAGVPSFTVQTFALTDGKGAVSQTVPNIAYGFYVAEDAAGNKSSVFQVKEPSAPEATRPPGTTLPEPPQPDTTSDPDGTKHAVYEETVEQEIDRHTPLFEGALDATDARGIVEDRWQFISDAGELLTATVELLSADGTAPLSSLSTTEPGECLIRAVATDAAGNTTTVNIHYVFKEPINAGPSNNPDPDTADPDPGPGNADPDPGEPPTVTLTPGPGGTPTPLKPEPVSVSGGTLHAIVNDDMVVGTRNLKRYPSDFAALFKERYSVASALSDAQLRAGEVALFDSSGNPLDFIDLSTPGDYVVEQTYADSAGNTTTVRLSYRVREETVSGTLGGGAPASDVGADAKGRHGSNTTLTALPQTGPFGVPCPLQPLFLALAAVVALYGAVRLRMETALRRTLKTEDAWVRDREFGDEYVDVVISAALVGVSAEDLVGRTAAYPPDSAPRRRAVLDGIVLGVVAALALAIAAVPWCAYDLLLALCVALLCVACWVLIHVSAWSTARTRRQCWLAEWVRSQGVM